ncbi:acylphosphatase [Chloroflexota bacterium]
MSDLSALQVIVYGRVQGVFFRGFASRQARNLGLVGYVCNLSGGRAVEVWAEGERRNLEVLLGYLKVGPPESRVAKMVAKWSEYTGGYPDFTVRY